MLCNDKYSFSPRFDSIRYFNTTCSNSNEQSPKKSNIEDPDKKPDKNEDIRSFLTKLSLWFILMYICLIALKHYIEMHYTKTEVSFY